jgi:hypothetical protein
MAETSFYISVEPRWSAYDPEQLAGIVASKITQRRPQFVHGVVVKLKLKIPDAAFKPLQPEVVIDVPEEALDYTPDVTVEFPEVS